jgi:hypothetical protein
LIDILPLDLDSALDAATLAVAEALRCEKVDAFLYEPSTSTLVARGTSPTPLGRKQHARCAPYPISKRSMDGHMCL